jgi:hypothetical protein
LNPQKAPDENLNQHKQQHYEMFVHHLKTEFICSCLSCLSNICNYN